MAIDSFRPATRAAFWRRGELSSQRSGCAWRRLQWDAREPRGQPAAVWRSAASCLLYSHVTHSRTRLFLLLCLFQSPREGEEHETAALATRRLDQLPEMIRLWPGIFLMTLQTLFSSHISLRESFNKSILGWKWFLQLFIIVVAVERGLSRLVAFYGHLKTQGTK